MSSQFEVETLEVEIERLLPGGLGLAHAGGRTVLVSLAAPGDFLRVKIHKVRGKVLFASIQEILRASPVRVEAPCPYFGSCGGCDFQQLEYQAQLNAKIEIVRDCLHRIAHLPSLPEIPIIASPSQWHYRSRANWQLDTEQQRIGYYERGTHRVCDVANCAVLVPELQQLLEEVRGIEPEMLPKDLGELEVVSGETGISVAPQLLDLKTRKVRRRIGEEVYTFSAKSFFQVNHALLEALVENGIAKAQGQVAVDLYCGVGLFTLPLARKLSVVFGIESNPGAADYARRNLKAAGLRNAQIVTGHVGRWLRDRAVHSGEPVDFLLLDPPRTGAEPEVVESILSLEARRIAYVSCDPATLARDLKLLIDGNYRLASIVALDLFPQTHHVETVVHLLNNRLPSV